MSTKKQKAKSVSAAQVMDQVVSDVKSVLKIIEPPREETKRKVTEKKERKKWVKKEVKREPRKKVPLPASPEAFLSILDKLPYDERMSLAAQIGEDNKENKELGLLIKRLREHPAPPASPCKLSEKEISLFPAQQGNIKFYHQDQVALQMAVAGGDSKSQGKEFKDLLIAELKGPSIFFSKLVINAIVRQVKEDATVVELIQTTTPKNRNLMVSCCVRYRRTKVLETLIPIFLEQYGPEVPSRFLHACSPAFVRKQLLEEKDSAFPGSPTIRWHKMANGHGAVMLELLERELKEDIGGQAGKWGEWMGAWKRKGNAVSVLLRKPDFSLQLLRLAIEYPFYGGAVQSKELTFPHDTSKWGESKLPLADSILKYRKLLTSGYEPSLPTVFMGDKEWWTSALRNHSETVREFLCATLCYTKEGRLFTSIPHQFWTSKIPREFTSVEKVWETYLLKPPVRSLSDYFIYGTMPKALIKISNPKEESKCLDLLLEFATRRYTMVNDAAQHSTWRTLATQTWKNLISTIRDRYRASSLELKTVTIDKRFNCVTAFLRNVENPLEITQAKNRHYGNLLSRISAHKIKTVTSDNFFWKEEDATHKISQANSICSDLCTDLGNSYHDQIPPAPTYPVENFVTWGPWFENIWSEGVTEAGALHHYRQNYARQLLRYLYSQRLNADTKDYADYCSKYTTQVLDFYLPKFGQDPLNTVGFLTDLFQYLQNEHKLQVFQVWNYDALLHFGRHNSTQLVTILEAIARVDVKHVAPAVAKLVAPNVLSDATRDQLLGFQEVTPEVWKGFIKATDSNSAANRIEGFRVLIQSAILSKSEAQLVKTLTHMVKKIKNESSVNRFLILNLALGTVNDDDSTLNTIQDTQYKQKRQTHDDAAFLLSERTLPFWSEMLQDALEVQDLDKYKDFPRDKLLNITSFDESQWAEILILKTDDDDKAEPKKKKEYVDLDAMMRNHYILGFFYKLSIFAIRKGATKVGTSGLFNFGADLQWRMTLFRLGDKEAIKKFELNIGKQLQNHRKQYKFDNSNSSFNVPYPADFPETFKEEKGERVLDVTLENKFIDAFLDVYAKYCPKRAPSTYLKDAYLATGKAALHNEKLKAHLSDLIKQIADAPKDTEGVSLIDEDHPAIIIFQNLLEIYGNKWLEMPLLVQYVETTLKSRQARTVMWAWIELQNSKGEQDRTRRAHRINRSKVVDGLLEVSKSAIYIRFVWRHLTRFATHKLDPFLNPKSTFRGVFYLDPAHRGKLPAKKEPKPAETGRRRRRTKVTKAPPVNPRRMWWYCLTPTKAGTTAYKAELKDEKRIVKEKKEGNKRDFLEWFVLPACYGLHRLLPRQIEQLSIQRLRTGLNSDRNMMDRTKAFILWTLLPTITYIDIITFIDKPQDPIPAEVKDDVDEDGKKKKEEKFAINFIEALMKGVMKNDERCAPLSYLFQPAFLSGQQARIAAFALSSCEPYIVPSKLNKIIQAVLSGERRHALKVTAYKEILRLVASKKTRKGMEMVLHEWNRDQLHRDVRIVCIQMAITFLSSPRAFGAEIGWQILETAVRREEKEILTALLGAIPSARGATESGSGVGLVHQERLLEHLEALKKRKIPKDHCERYAKNILHKLCADDIDDDVHHLALFSLVDWLDTEGTRKLAANLWRNLAISKEPAVIANDKPETQEVHNNRWDKAVTFLIDKICKANAYDIQKEDCNEYLIDIITRLIGYVQDSKGGSERFSLWNRLNMLANKFNNNPLNDFVVEPLKKMEPAELFWEFFVKREEGRINIYGCNINGPLQENDEYVRIVTKFISGVLEHLESNPGHTTFGLKLVTSFLERVKDHGGSDDYDERHFAVVNYLYKKATETKHDSYQRNIITILLLALKYYPKFSEKFYDAWRDILQNYILKNLASSFWTGYGVEKKNSSEEADVLYEGKIVKLTVIKDVIDFQSILDNIVELLYEATDRHANPTRSRYDRPHYTTVLDALKEIPEKIQSVFNDLLLAATTPPTAQTQIYSELCQQTLLAIGVKYPRLLTLFLGFGGIKPGGSAALERTGILFNSWIQTLTVTPFLYQSNNMAARRELVVTTIPKLIREFTGSGTWSQGEGHKENRLQIIDVVLKFDLFQPTESEKKKSKDIQRQELYSEISFDVALGVLEAFPNFVLQRIDATLLFIDIAILRATLYPAYSGDIRGRLVDILYDAFREEVQLVPETEEEKKLKRSKLEKLRAEEGYMGFKLDGVKQQLTKILDLLLESKQRPNTALHSSDPWSWLIRDDFNDTSKIRGSGQYTNVSALVALDFIVKLADYTKLKIQVKEEVEEKKVIKKKETKEEDKESENKKGKNKGKGKESKGKEIKEKPKEQEKKVEVEEEPPKEEKKEEKKEEFTPNRTIWRKIFEEYLAHFIRHPDGQIRRQAYYVVTSKPIVDPAAVKKKPVKIKVADVQNKKRR